MEEVSLKIWKTKERREKVDQLKRLTYSYEALEEKSSAVGLEITSKSNEIAEIERQVEQLNRRKEEAGCVEWQEGREGEICERDEGRRKGDKAIGEASERDGREMECKRRDGEERSGSVFRSGTETVVGGRRSGRVNNCKTGSKQS
eukprot:TRINITY_DN4080_c0_g2_i4.p1 TRINITY_DN4080_c0_g2~~TRINITY_DN4080_c0_g2_i4.p1  ORF type:complete len:171 (-),score=78.80 TRINITY_DN4080_c0_g2_i4:93-530(-)